MWWHFVPVFSTILLATFLQPLLTRNAGGIEFMHASICAVDYDRALRQLLSSPGSPNSPENKSMR